MKIAILGFGHQPPAKNLTIAEAAAIALFEHNVGIAVGNLTGTFATALETSAKLGGKTLAVIDQSMIDLPYPDTTEVIVVEPALKHSAIAQLADGALIIGGAAGTTKLADQFIAINKPLAAIVGTGGVVDDGTLPGSIPACAELNEAILYLLESLRLS